MRLFRTCSPATRRAGGEYPVELLSAWPRWRPNSSSGDYRSADDARVYNSAYYEHSFWPTSSASNGEGRDLIVRTMKWLCRTTKA